MNDLRAAFTETVAGQEYRFALPLGGLRKIAEHDPKIFALTQRLIDRQATLADIEAVLLAAVGSASAVASIIEAGGVLRATECAARILYLAMTEEPGGNGTAAPTEN
jgi:hypothetical protein